jgi:hypothetical protein
LLIGALWLIGLLGGSVALVCLRGKHARLEKLEAWTTIILGMLPLFIVAVVLLLDRLGF